MRWLKIGAMIFVLALPSYAASAGPEDALGDPLIGPLGAAARSGGAITASPALGGARRGLAGEAPPARRIGQVLVRLKPDAQVRTRGAAEAAIYQQASPSVVLVVTREGLGSGVVVGADGKVVTNYHVVEGYEQVGVVFKPAQEGAEVSKADVRLAEVVKVDQVADLALLQVKDMPAGVKPLALGEVASLKVGADVHAIGHPDGESWTYTRGIVSQIRRDYAWTTESNLEHKATVIQTQTPINPGNSGGPLINEQLQVVGINSFVSDGEGLNFAVSADDVRAFLARSGDRATAKAAGAKAGEKECEIKDLKAWREDKAEHTLVDLDCDGKGDAVFVEPDEKTQPIKVLIDEDGDGKVDTVYFDPDRDGDPDGALYDTDGDNEPDLIGYFKDGEWEPYQWERYEPEKAARR